MTTPPLCIADDATFWPWHSWADLAALPVRERVLVVLPVAGFADWGLDAPLDAEETVLLHVLRAASVSHPEGVRLLVLPPLRFVLGPAPECAFAVDSGVAHALIREWVESVASAGFRRVVLYNSSPWNEELCDVAARDLRIECGLEMFCLNLSGLGLDFHPQRDGERKLLRTLLDASRHETGTGVHPAFDGPGQHLARLLQEISARPPLPDRGILRTKEAPR